MSIKKTITGPVSMVEKEIRNRSSGGNLYGLTLHSISKMYK
jgi:hypothetical protein